jgi:hypothetical protein
LPKPPTADAGGDAGSVVHESILYIVTQQAHPFKISFLLLLQLVFVEILTSHQHHKAANICFITILVIR